MQVSAAVLEARKRLKERMGSGSVQVGGKGSMRRKIKQKVPESKTDNSDKLDLVLKKIGVSDFGDVEELYIFFNNSDYCEFRRPKFYGSVKHSTFIISGECLTRKIDMSSVFKGFQPNTENVSLGKDVIGKLREGAFKDLIKDSDSVDSEKKHGSSVDKFSRKFNDSSNTSNSNDVASDEDSSFKRKELGNEKKKKKDKKKEKKKGKGILLDEKKIKESDVDPTELEKENEKRTDGLKDVSLDKCDIDSGNFVPEVDDFEEYAKD